MLVKQEEAGITRIFIASVTTFSFCMGAFCSGMCGYVGMWVSVRANVRVAGAARRSAREALVIAYDSVPAAILYRLGRNGWWLEGQAQLATVPALQARGARFIAARGDRRAHVASYGPPLFEVDGLAVYPLSR